jgi:hypothetical protein
MQLSFNVFETTESSQKKKRLPELRLGSLLKLMVKYVFVYFVLIYVV